MTFGKLFMVSARVMAPPTFSEMTDATLLKALCAKPAIAPNLAALQAEKKRVESAMPLALDELTDDCMLLNELTALRALSDAERKKPADLDVLEFRLSCALFNCDWVSFNPFCALFNCSSALW